MKTHIGALIAGLLAGMLWPHTVEGQSFVYAGGGTLVPMGDYGDYAKTGWMGVLGVGRPIGQRGFSIGLEGIYGSNTHKDLAGDKTNLPGVVAWADVRIGNQSKPGPYAVAMFGTLNHQYKSKMFPDADENVWKAVFGIGAGVDIPLHGPALFIEARYMSRDQTNFAPLLAGLSFPLGARK